MPYEHCGITTLARLTHCAEDTEDDLTFMAIQNEVEQRPPLEQELYRREYIRLYPVMAKERNMLKVPK